MEPHVGEDFLSLRLLPREELCLDDWVNWCGGGLPWWFLAGYDFNLSGSELLEWFLGLLCAAFSCLLCFLTCPPRFSTKFSLCFFGGSWGLTGSGIWDVIGGFLAVLLSFKPSIVRSDGLMTCFVISSRKAENCNFPCTKFALACSIPTWVTPFPFSLFGSCPCLEDSTSIDLALRMSLEGSLFFRMPLLGSWLEDTALLGLLETPNTMSSSLKARLRFKLLVLYNDP